MHASFLETMVTERTNRAMFCSKLCPQALHSWISESFVSCEESCSLRLSLSSKNRRPDRVTSPFFKIRGVSIYHCVRPDVAYILQEH